MVAGFVYRIHQACSTWENFHVSLGKPKCILECNQSPPDFYEPIIQKALDKIVNAGEANESNESKTAELREVESHVDKKHISKRLVFIEYRGKVTDDYCRALRKIDAPCQPVLTLRKLKTVLPSLKPTIEKRIRSHIVYLITCPRCKSCYIGASCRCLGVRFGEHKRPSQPVGKHSKRCNALQDISMEDVKILASTTRSEQYLFTLEALW